MVYNHPLAYRVDMKPEHMLKLADCKWITAIKESRAQSIGYAPCKVPVGRLMR